MKEPRKRVKNGILVASTNPLKDIMSKRLQILVRYTTIGLSNTVISSTPIGIRREGFNLQ